MFESTVIYNKILNLSRLLWPTWRSLRLYSDKLQRLTRCYATMHAYRSVKDTDLFESSTRT